MKTDVETHPAPQAVAPVRPEFVPETDIYENGDAFVVVAEMPGVDEKGLEITLEDRVLTVSGTQEPEEYGGGYHLDVQGCRKGIYRRSLRLLADIDQEKIRASVRNGIVRIELPRSAKSKPRKISVTAGE